MSKKSKASRRAARNVASSAVVARPAAPVPASKPTGASISGRPFEREFNPDYTPVIKDLKRIGTLAGTFFILLIVLSFFLK